MNNDEKNLAPKKITLYVCWETLNKRDIWSMTPGWKQTRDVKGTG